MPGSDMDVTNTGIHEYYGISLGKDEPYYERATPPM